MMNQHRCMLQHHGMATVFVLGGREFRIPGIRNECEIVPGIFLGIIAQIRGQPQSIHLIDTITKSVHSDVIRIVAEMDQPRIVRQHSLMTSVRPCRGLSRIMPHHIIDAILFAPFRELCHNGWRHTVENLRHSIVFIFSYQLIDYSLFRVFELISVSLPPLDELPVELIRIDLSILHISVERADIPVVRGFMQLGEFHCTDI